MTLSLGKGRRVSGGYFLLFDGNDSSLIHFGSQLAWLQTVSEATEREESAGLSARVVQKARLRELRAHAPTLPPSVFVRMTYPGPNHPLLRTTMSSSRIPG